MESNQLAWDKIVCYLVIFILLIPIFKFLVFKSKPQFIILKMFLSRHTCVSVVSNGKEAKNCASELAGSTKTSLTIS